MSSSWSVSWGFSWGSSWGFSLAGGKYPDTAYKKPKVVEVDSSHLKNVQYDKNLGTLEIGFKTGEKYSYAGVPEKRYKGIVRAESSGKYLHNNIKGMYSHRKVNG